MNGEKEILNFVLVGAKHTGKTVYLSVLYGAESSIITSNKDTKTYLQDHWRLLKQGETPSATSSRLILLDLVYKSEDYNVPFRIDDYDGYFAESLSEDDSATQKDRKILKSNIQESEGILLFFPYEEMFDEKALERFRHEINTFINLVQEVHPNNNDIPIPLVIGVSKWDRTPYFRKADEVEKAVEYINSVESYRTAKELVENYFSDVRIIPFSSFGTTNDGIHPVKGNIEPYNITKPLDYFLTIFFSLFEQRVEMLTKESNTIRLYQFLYQWLHVVRFYKNGKYQKLFENVSNQYKDKILALIRKAVSTEDHKSILEKHCYYLETVADDKLNKMIHSEISRTKSTKNRRKLLWATGITVLVAIVCCFILFFIHTKNEENLILKVRESAKIAPYNRISLCDKYIANYEKNIAEVERFRAAAIEEATQRLENRYEQVRKLKHRDKNLSIVRDVEIEADYYPNLMIAENIKAFAAAFKKQNKDRSEILKEAKNHLNSSQPISANVTETLNILRKYDDNDVEVSTVIEPLANLAQRLEVKESLQYCTNAIKHMNTDQDNWESDIKNILRNNWNDGFSTEHQKELIKLINTKFENMDREAIGDLKGIYERRTEISSDWDKINVIKQHSLDINRLDYRYERPDFLKNKLNDAERNLNKYQRVLDYGLDVFVSFVALEKENEPLGFDCIGSIDDNHIILTILQEGSNKWKFHYKNDSCTCSHNGDKQIMTWHNKTMRLKIGRLSVAATETAWSNDEIKGSISINDELIFEIMNSGWKEYLIENTNYLLRFSKR